MLEVALHCGALAALLPRARRELAGRGVLSLVAVGTAPAGLVGVLFERRVENRLGTPAMIAVGLCLGGVALALADLRPQTRRAEEAGASDAVWLGLAQAAALLPGVSRNGATLAMARTRRFHRADAGRLSRRLAFPVIAGATLLKAWRVRERPELTQQGPQLLAGAFASCLSTALASRRIGNERSERPLAGYGLYRVGLGGLVLVRLRATRGVDRSRLGQAAQDQGQAAPV